jgi:hypothetical protein
LASAIAGAVVDHAVSNNSSGSRPSPLPASSTSTTSLDSRYVAYESEINALGIATSMDSAALHVFGIDECAAARRARSDQGAGLLKFKRDHVASAYNANDQLAIETFRTLFIATGHLLCPDVETTIRAASSPLL